MNCDCFNCRRIFVMIKNFKRCFVRRIYIWGYTMQYKEKTERGNIIIDKNVIASMVLNQVEQFGGKVIVSNYKANPLGVAVKKNLVNDINDVEVDYTQRGMEIKIYIMVKFGTSIGTVTNKIIESVYEDVKTCMGLEPNSISVVVTGIISKNIAKRNIEVRR